MERMANSNFFSSLFQVQTQVRRPSFSFLSSLSLAWINASVLGDTSVRGDTSALGDDIGAEDGDTSVVDGDTRLCATQRSVRMSWPYLIRRFRRRRRLSPGFQFHPQLRLLLQYLQTTSSEYLSSSKNQY